MLSEARKYRLNLILAHQFIKQLPEEISSAIFGPVRTMVMLRVGQEDGDFLAQYLAPLFGTYDLINLDNFHAYGVDGDFLWRVWPDRRIDCDPTLVRRRHLGIPMPPAPAIKRLPPPPRSWK